MGITNWHRYVLDNLTGGNFLGTPALEASLILECLLGIPPVKEIKVEISLEDVMKKLEGMESLPSIDVKLDKLLDNTEKIDKSLEALSKKIVAFETCFKNPDQNARIEEIEGVIDTMSKTFSSFKTKKQEYILDRGKNSCMYQKGLNPSFLLLMCLIMNFTNLLIKHAVGLLIFLLNIFLK